MFYIFNDYYLWSVQHIEVDSLYRLILKRSEVLVNYERNSFWFGTRVFEKNLNRFLIRPIFFLEKTNEHLFYDLIRVNKNYNTIYSIIKPRENIILTNQYTYDLIDKNLNLSYVESNKLKLGVIFGFVTLSAYFCFK